MYQEIFVKNFYNEMLGRNSNYGTDPWMTHGLSKLDTNSLDIVAAWR